MLVTYPAIHACLLTGPPGCGKTTVIRRLIERLDDLRLAGFYTQEVREKGQRVGFEAISLSGRQPVPPTPPFSLERQQSCPVGGPFLVPRRAAFSRAMHLCRAEEWVS
jgi:nucleoside-triphosphatase